MAIKASEEKVTIDGTDYALKDLSENAKISLAHIQFVDSQLLQLNNEWAVADTARIAYTNALRAEVSKIEEKE